MLVGQIVFHRTVPLVLHGTGLDGHIGLSVLVGQVGFHRTVPLVLHGTDGIGWTGFHRTVPLVLHGTGGIGRTHRIECVGGTDSIP